jgi:hypothetical protein
MYAKPEIVVMGSAISEIQGCSGPKNGGPIDCGTHESVNPAYEADE